MPASNRIIEKLKTPIIRLADSVGDGSGVTDFALNFPTLTIYKTVVPAGLTYHITELIVHFIGSGGISPIGFGGGAALINGIHVHFVINGVEMIISQLDVVKTNYELSIATSVVFVTNYSGNDRGFTGELNIEHLGVDNIALNGDDGDYIEVLLHDDFTSRIDVGTFVFQGHSISNT